ncbi:hypothetical protein EN828_10535 [Mesorhizobium sp. M2D.F.Ca.ET.185.01.1.1]|uniref:hypothetical protein n=1 Tax=unclassified Mesorhizobium TaxID=325217 RepID=UPI000FCAC115|nr:MULTISPECIES: hypothetical protein [unclassified Mesorhizobium]TGT97825.1 hypothetical protein EN806_48460 [bacterium M00.F.Ca.ET.163.01.1.1]TGU44608.1 hypothetical protein EN789_21635 [bacterium M00.F.Ca.ET.146.01.1.1]TGV81410.1 hypothetical protein EN792_034730 [Mesorhizobium sp. M00.F.Ca.ET.149.01.1.1]TGW09944.1 hypothetical protein EN788_22085 [Mesorhizobium sp. M2D.F.Ca.ET.145.01.1.1]TGP24625.1 hypothetical protein EN875_034875 [Mesorhizobium sp. M2D.F.Ca.ET.232.01.1.1]
MSVLETALARRAQLQAELRIVDKFIADYKKFKSGTGIPVNRVTVAGRPAEAFEHMLKVLSSADEPLSRQQIIDACLADGYQMPGLKPGDYVGVLAHRNKDKIEAIGGRYQLRPTASAE